MGQFRWQFWNLCSPEEKVCSWYNSEHVYLYWLWNYNSEQQHYLFFWWPGTKIGAIDPQEENLTLFHQNDVFFFYLTFLSSICIWLQHFFKVFLCWFSWFLYRSDVWIKELLQYRDQTPRLWKCFSRSCLHYRLLEPCPFKELFVCLLGNKEGIWLKYQ